jgi:hypothetical protein
MTGSKSVISYIHPSSPFNFANFQKTDPTTSQGCHTITCSVWTGSHLAPSKFSKKGIRWDWDLFQRPRSR